MFCTTCSASMCNACLCKLIQKSLFSFPALTSYFLYSLEGSHDFLLILFFLVRIIEHIETSTKNIRKEMEEFLKLCHWERPQKLLSIENTKRNRQKLKKLMQKYTVSNNEI